MTSIYDELMRERDLSPPTQPLPIIPPIPASRKDAFMTALDQLRAGVDSLSAALTRAQQTISEAAAERAEVAELAAVVQASADHLDQLVADHTDPAEVPVDPTSVDPAAITFPPLG